MPTNVEVVKISSQRIVYSSPIVDEVIGIEWADVLDGNYDSRRIPFYLELKVLYSLRINIYISSSLVIVESSRLSPIISSTYSTTIRKCLLLSTTIILVKMPHIALA